MKKNASRWIWWFTIPLFAGIVISSLTGLYSIEFYSRETLNWQIQSRGQDYIDLFLAAPLLVITAWLSTKRIKTAFSFWAGTNLYIAYTFTIFCFDVQFNILFLVYCFNLGLSVYSLLYFLYHISREYDDSNDNPTFFKVTAVYFILIALLFYGLWISTILPAIMNNSVPEEITQIGTPTNPVHVIDLSILLPSVFATGIMLWKGKKAGILLAPVILIFFVMMNVTIAILNYMMMKEFPQNNPVITWIMVALALFSLVLSIKFVSCLEEKPALSNSNPA